MYNLNYGFIGSGNAGNQMVELLFENGFLNEKYENLLAMNTSEKDLDQLNEAIIKIKIGQHGAAKERSFAKEQVKKSYKQITEHKHLVSLINNSDVIFLINSTGGGSGSGIIPILTALLKKQYQNKIFLNIAIFPDSNADLQAFRNSMEFLKEIKDLDYRMLPYSNDKAEGKSISEKQKYVNNQILLGIKALMGYFNRENENSMIDERDNIKLMNTAGIIKITHIQELKEKMLDEKSFDDILISAINKAAFIDLDKDQIQKRIGFISNLNSSVYNKIDRSYLRLKDEFGTPAEIFENLGIVENDEVTKDPAITFIQSGLSFPNDLLDDLSDRVEQILKVLNSKKEVNVNKFDILNDVEDNSFNILIGENTKDNYEDNTLSDEIADDILKNF